MKHKTKDKALIRSNKRVLSSRASIQVCRTEGCHRAVSVKWNTAQSEFYYHCSSCQEEGLSNEL